MNVTDDVTLMLNVSNGDKEAFQVIFNRYWKLLHNIVFNRLGSADVADDLVQDLFVELWNNRKTIRIEDSLKGYLHQSVKYKIYNYIRNTSLRQKKVYIEHIKNQYYSNQAVDRDMEPALHYRELENLIHQELLKLSVQSRKIFILSREKQFTYQEIAHLLNCSTKNVEYHISKVLGILKIRLSEYLS